MSVAARAIPGFDLNDNSFKLDVIGLVAQVPVTKPRDAGKFITPFDYEE